MCRNLAAEGDLRLRAPPIVELNEAVAEFLPLNKQISAIEQAKKQNPLRDVLFSLSALHESACLCKFCAIPRARPPSCALPLLRKPDDGVW